MRKQMVRTKMVRGDRRTVEPRTVCKGEDLLYNLSAMEERFSTLKEAFYYDELELDEMQQIALGFLETADRYKRAYEELASAVVQVTNNSKMKMY